MIHLYGQKHNRTFRSFWMLEELGLAYQDHPLDTRSGETRTPEFLAINPNGHVPTLVDEDAPGGPITIWESMAINLYLAKRHGGGLAPASLEEEAQALQWSFWAMTELEGELMTYGMNTKYLPEADRDEAAAKAAGDKLSGALGVLEGALAGRSWLGADRFSVTDLNVASVLSWWEIMNFDIAGFPGVARWYQRCIDRPAAKKLRAT